MPGLAKRHGLLALATLALALVTTFAILRLTGGEPAVPLDDAFIHFQYARSFARGTPFEYSPGAEPAAGATSLLWPLLLAPFIALGVDDVGVVWVAWAFGWLCLGALAHETRKAAEGLVSDDTALGAGLLVLTFGGYVWFAASGMEVVPFAWLLMRAARSASEWVETDGPPGSRARTALVVVGALGPALRPEGAIAAAIAAIALLARPRGGRRAWAAIPVVGIALPPLAYLLVTGTATSTTAIVKWLPKSPYHDGEALVRAVLDNLATLFLTLLDGRVWSAVFVPEGTRAVAWAALLAIPVAALVKGRWFRGMVVFAVALGMLLPTTYDSFLWNRLRYLWPFAAAWFVGIAALSEGIGALAGFMRPGFERMRLLAIGACAGAFATHLSWAIEDVATSADAIRRQQVALGRWARDSLPDDAIIGVNDTGAIAYLSGKRTFDVVGLTTSGEARYWVNGAGSRFEHFERMDRAALPTHFIVYPEWLRMDPVLGRELHGASVAGATILGGERMVAYEASYGVLGLADLPDRPPSRAALLDVLDVADLESEASHSYRVFGGHQWTNVVVGDQAGADGGRIGRTLDQFEIVLAPGGAVVARMGSNSRATLRVLLDGTEIGALRLSGVDWEEVLVQVPNDVRAGAQPVEIRAGEGEAFTSMCYWSYARALPLE